MADRITELLMGFRKRLDRLERRAPSKGASNPSGTVLAWAGPVQNIPSGYVLCDGATYQVAEQGKLFQAIGTTYGQDGTGTFRVPDLRSRVPVGVDTRDADFNTHGRTGGTKTHTLTVNQMPSHSHDYFRTRALASEPISPDTGTAYGTLTGLENTKTERSTGARGGGQSHPNLQPYMALNYIIKL